MEGTSAFSKIGYNGDMGKKAVAAYIRTMRDRQGLTLAYVAQAAKTSESQILRIERGDQETRYSVLFGVIDALRGNLGHIRYLLLDEGTTPEEGQQLAEDWLNLTPEERDRAILTTSQKLAILQATTPPDELVALFAEVGEELDPGLLRAIRALVMGWQNREKESDASTRH